MGRKNHRGTDRRGTTGQRRGGERSPARRPRVPLLDDIDPPNDAHFATGPTYHVIVTSHAARQLDELGPPAETALRYLREATRDELMWSAQPMPSQHGREVWLLGAGSVRVLFDVEEDDLTVQGFGLQPHRRSFGW